MIHDNGAMHRDFWSKCFKDKRGHITLWQRPNAPLLIWLAAAVLGRLLHGQAQHITRSISIGALLVWALLELFSGVNYFRRALGLVVLVMMVITVLR